MGMIVPFVGSAWSVAVNADEKEYLFVHLSGPDGEITFGHGTMAEFPSYCEKHRLSPRFDVTIVDGMVLKPEGVSLQ
jgi:hypothetical protein